MISDILNIGLTSFMGSILMRQTLAEQNRIRKDTVWLELFAKVKAEHSKYLGKCQFDCSLQALMVSNAYIV